VNLQKTLLPFFFLFFISCSNAFVLNEKSFQEDAQSWVNSYIWNEHNGLLIPKEDLQLIANLCYFSFQRSHATLKAQQHALLLLSALWNGWQNVAHTRLDPSKNVPHAISNTEKKLSAKDFWMLHDQHYTIGKAYSKTVETIVNSDALITTKALNGVKNMRSQARGVVAQALVDVRKLLGKLFHDPAKKSVPIKKGFELLNHLWAYIPQLAVYSFAEADKLNNRVSEDGWMVLHTVQDVGSKTWNAIEEARASFYLAHYNALYKPFAQAEVEIQYRQIMFDQHGLLPKTKQSKPLPIPLLGF